MSPAKHTIRKGYRSLNSIYLDAQFIEAHSLVRGLKYPVRILPDEETEGTLQKTGALGGLAVLYNSFSVIDGDEIELEFDGTSIIIDPKKSATDVSNPEYIFEREQLRHIHIEAFSPGALSRWTPRTETDVYLVFGILQELTNYRYVCGSSTEILNDLGYSVSPLPDAILLDASSKQYLIGEFKIYSKDFPKNHKKKTSIC